MHCLIVLLACEYVLLLAFSISFVSANIPLDHRLLSPLFTLIVILLPAMTWKLPDQNLRARYRTVFASVSCVLIVVSALNSRETVSDIAGFGAGYASVGWQDSELINFVDRLPPSVVLISNEPGAVWFWSRRTTHALPSPVNGQSGLVNEYFDSVMENIEAEVREGRAAVLYFTSRGSDWYDADSERIMSLFDSVESLQAEDGVLFFTSSAQLHDRQDL